MIHERMTVNETMKSRHMLNVMFAFFVSFEGLKIEDVCMATGRTGSKCEDPHFAVHLTC